MSGVLCADCEGYFQSSDHLCGAKLKKELDDLKAQLTDAEDEVTSMETKLESKIEELESELSDTKDELDDAKNSISEFEDRIDRFERDMPDPDDLVHRDAMNELEDRMDKIENLEQQSRLDDVEERYANLLAKLSKNFPDLFKDED